MGQHKKLSTIDFLVIQQHNNLLIDACASALLELRDVPNDLRDKNYKGRVSYWKNVKSGLKWSTELARQRSWKPSVNRPYSV